MAPIRHHSPACAWAVRALIREPQFSLMIIVTLGLGIGANAAMFGIIDRLLLSGPAHVVDADRAAVEDGPVHLASLAGAGSFGGDTVMRQYVEEQTAT